jgi:hypothetical protein
VTSDVDRLTADECDYLSGAALWGYGSPAGGDIDDDREIGDDGGMGNHIRVAVLCVSVVVLAASARQQPQPSNGGYTNFSSPSGGGGGCKKGCRCGNACIECSKQCHGGATYRKRKR